MTDLHTAHELVSNAIGHDEFDSIVDLIQKCPALSKVKNNKDETLLHELSSCFRSYRPVEPAIRLLVSAGADIEARDANGFTPLHCAVCPPQANLEALGVLIELGADVNAPIQDTSPLHLAASDRSRVGAVAMLVAHGADVNARDSKGQTPLHYAAQNGLIEDVKILLANGADPKLKQEDGVTPLAYATVFAHPEVVDLLQKQTKEELLPAWKLAEFGHIHAQIERGDPKTVAGMLDYKPELLYAVSELGGWTPMTVAAREGRIDMLEVLVAHGGDVNALDKDGISPTYAARSYNRDATVCWLHEHGATPAHRSRRVKAKGKVFSWNKIQVIGEKRCVPDETEFSRLRDFLGTDFPPGYLEFMKTFGFGELGEQLYLYSPDGIIANHERERSWLISRFPPAEYPYENGTELFTPDQIQRIVIAAHVHNADSMGFVRGEPCWYLFPRDGLIEFMGDDLGGAIAWLIGNGTFDMKSKLKFKPIFPKDGGE